MILLTLEEVSNPTITQDEYEFIITVPNSGILRNLMSSDEIKLANSLVKKGLLLKGKSDDKQRTTQFTKIDAWDDFEQYLMK